MPNYIEKLPEDAVQVKNALCWVTPAGNLYGQETRTLYNKKLDKKFRTNIMESSSSITPP